MNTISKLAHKKVLRLDITVREVMFPVFFIYHILLFYINCYYWQTLTEPATNYQNKYYSVSDWKDKYISFIGINLVFVDSARLLPGFTHIHIKIIN